MKKKKKKSSNEGGRRKDIHNMCGKKEILIGCFFLFFSI
jgi:hypothetical protein